jgi:hypothetical protein
VRPDEANLLGGRRGPLRGGVGHAEAAHGNVIATRPVGVETTVPHVDFDQFAIRILIMEIGVDIGELVVDFREPGVDGTCGVPDFRDRFRVQHALQQMRFKKRFAVEIDLASVMGPAFVGEPVAGDHVFVWVVLPKQGVWHDSLPG